MARRKKAHVIVATFKSAVLETTRHVKCGEFITYFASYLQQTHQIHAQSKTDAFCKMRENKRPVENGMSLSSIPPMQHMCTSNVKVPALDPYQLFGFEPLNFLQLAPLGR